MFQPEQPASQPTTGQEVPDADPFPIGKKIVLMNFGESRNLIAQVMQKKRGTPEYIIEIKKTRERIVFDPLKTAWEACPE